MRMSTGKLFILFFLLIVLPQAAPAQPAFASETTRTNPLCTPPKNRELFHDIIDQQQKLILKADGKDDNRFSPSANDEVNFMVTRSLVTRVDELQCKIENDTLLKDQQKVLYLRGIENLLKFFYTNYTSRKVNPVMLPDIITLYEQCMQKDERKESFESLILPVPYDVGYSVLKADRLTFQQNTGLSRSLNHLILKYCQLHPDKIFQTLFQNPEVPFADSLVRVAGPMFPRQLYDFAQSNSKLANIIHNIRDDYYISSVSQMARSKSGQQYFPFLDNIIHGKTSIAQIDSVKEDSVLYYRLLVKTHLDYVDRAMNGDTAIEYNALTEKLEKRAREVFVNVINGLHTESAEVRFRIIQPLSPQELYYLAVASDGSIYTSSFVKGVYPLMMKKCNNRGDSLLELLRFDKYRKFIKMSAGYNTLSNFLSSFPPAATPGGESDAEKLMKAFVGRLELGKGLEDGVDVADSYASIAETLSPIAKQMLKNVQLNYQRNLSAGNKRGMAMYKILNDLFLSADSTKNIDLTKELGIPPVYKVPYSTLLNDSGRVVMQVFFYGDKDGQGIFKGFIGMFSNANWKITGTDKWVCISSVKGKPVSIYANRALPEETGEDDKAQKDLCAYLAKNNLKPSVTIHRGHSYYAGSTIEQMASSSKIVFLGSCGGYHLVHDVLEISPDAHIIATKQIGATEVNRPFFQLLTDKARNGADIDWIPFWKELDRMILAKEFEDYIPPYKNLGALFIKAYKIAMEE
ncbi:MAG: hypothetical protein IPP73_13560 [Chitinophagaceae bacterium]|nr:hypothetical protein [Chitinophagaceae bacterium]